MASTLTVDNIQGATATDKVMIPGHVVQVVTSTAPTLNVTVTGTAITDSGLFVNITPTSATSKIFVTSSFNGGSDAAGAGAVFYIYRDSTKIMGQGGDYSSAGGSTYGGHALSILDSPATTSQITYKIRLHCQSAGQVARFHTDYGSVTGEVATITAMEIAQ